MKNDQSLKEMVRQKYSEIALQGVEVNKSSCCGSGGCSTEVYNVMSEDYSSIEGYNPEADLGLGCGLPTEFAQINLGDVVIDLGSGAGNDCFIARKLVGDKGKVIGIDFTEAMVGKARENAEKLEFNNVEFRLGDIEKMPVSADTANVVVSNCVLNLVPNKDNVLKEILRVLKPSGHFSISDIVLEGQLPEKIKNVAEMYAGCISGAIQMEEYLGLIDKNGFINVTVQKKKAIYLPDDILSQYLSREELTEFRRNSSAIYSVTVYGDKGPTECCEPGSGCC